MQKHVHCMAQSYLVPPWCKIFVIFPPACIHLQICQELSLVKYELLYQAAEVGYLPDTEQSLDLSRWGEGQTPCYDRSTCSDLEGLSLLCLFYQQLPVHNTVYLQLLHDQPFQPRWWINSVSCNVLPKREKREVHSQGERWGLFFSIRN